MLRVELFLPRAQTSQFLLRTYAGLERGNAFQRKRLPKLHHDFLLQILEVVFGRGIRMTRFVNELFVVADERDKSILKRW